LRDQIWARESKQMNTSDPVVTFAIETYRAALARLHRTCDATDAVQAGRDGRAITKADRREYAAADVAERTAALALSRTLPTTKDGAKEMRKYVSERFRGREDAPLLATALRGIELCPAGVGLKVNGWSWSQGWQAA
jgi:hypothetical protein